MIYKVLSFVVTLIVIAILHILFDCPLIPVAVACFIIDMFAFVSGYMFALMARVDKLWRLHVNKDKKD